MATTTELSPVTVVDDDRSYNRMKELKEFDESKAGVKGLVDSGIKHIPRIFIHPAEDLPKPSDRHDASLRVPVIDLHGLDDAIRRKQIVDEISEASKSWGFFQLLNHGMPPSVLDSMLRGAKRFHEQDTEVKAKLYSHDALKKVLFVSNFDLFTSPAANWRDTFRCSSFDDKGLDADELPSILREEAQDYRNHAVGVAKTVCELLSEALGIWIIASISTVFTLIVHSVLFWKHLAYDDWTITDPYKNNVLKIFLLMPVFSITTLLSLFILRASTPFELMRALTEAIALYAFLLLMKHLLGGSKESIEKNLEDIPPGPYFAVPPFFCCFKSCFPYVRFNHRRVVTVEIGVLQYLIVRPLTMVVGFVLYFTGHFQEGEMSFNQGYPYIKFINAASVLLAAYYLFVIYKAIHQKYHHFQLTAKFLAIKLVILVSVIQGLILALLDRGDTLGNVFGGHAIEAEGWQNFLLSIEMSFVSLLFVAAFPLRDHVMLKSLETEQLTGKSLEMSKSGSV